MVVAVTGASGTVGSVIAESIANENIAVRKLVRPETDVLDMAGLIKALEGADVVVHAAGLVSFNPRNKRHLFDINVQGTKNVVNACLAVGTKKLVHISSVAALGAPPRNASAERSSSQSNGSDEQGRHRNGTLINEESRWMQGMATSDYAQSKYLSELEVYRGMEEGLQISVVNPSVVLAAGDGSRSSSALFGYVWQQRKFYTDFSLNYVDARDVAEMVLRLVRGNHNGEKFIASAGVVSLGTVLNEIAKRFQKSAPSINVPLSLAGAAARFEELRAAISGSEPLITRQSVRALREKLVFENEKAKKILGMEFKSLEKTLDWCCNEYRENLGAL
jgi:nucleoside-diphosphate-sugar epimerase